MHEMQTVAFDDPCVCQAFVTQLCCADMAERIEVLLRAEKVMQNNGCYSG